ncbi:MAG: cell wall-active antibiotics response protein [Chloroflexi bacterium]|nr:cell wall-active antibiotics response protein [Chloroflexota bacterium]
MSEPFEKNFERPHRPKRHNSMFGPIVLIAIGVYFLLNNLGYVGDINWTAALQLWPLALILLGLNIIVRQAPGILGGFLSALVGLLAVAIFGYALFFGADNPVLERFGVKTSPPDLKTEQIEFAAEGVETAVINIDFGFPHAELYALNDSANLIEGQVTYRGDLIFDTDVSGDSAVVKLDEQTSGDWFFNPSNWGSFTSDDQWQIGLNPRVETDLTLDVSAGSVSLDLSELTLNHLEVDGGAGSAEIWLPGGDYDVNYDISAGSTKMTLPGYGRHAIEIDGGAGSLTLYLPPGVEARVEVDGGAGSFRLNEQRFHQVSGDEKDEGAWETAAYDNAANQLNLRIDVSAGSVRIEDLQGR